MVSWRRGLSIAAGVMTLAAISVAEAGPIGPFHLGIDNKVVIEFQFAPQPPQTALAFGLAAIGVSAGCSYSLYDAGGLISVGTLASTCNGATWSATATAYSSSAGINVDLSGLAAGEIGRLEFTPIGPGSPTITYDVPTILFFNNANATILGTSIVAANAVAEPGSLALLLGGIAGLRFMRRRRAG